MRGTTSVRKIKVPEIKEKERTDLFNIFIMKYLFLKEMYKWNQHSDILAFTFEKQKHRGHVVRV